MIDNRSNKNNKPGDALSREVPLPSELPFFRTAPRIFGLMLGAGLAVVTASLVVIVLCGWAIELMPSRHAVAAAVLDADLPVTGAGTLNTISNAPGVVLGNQSFTTAPVTATGAGVIDCWPGYAVTQLTLSGTGEGASKCSAVGPQ